MDVASLFVGILGLFISVAGFSLALWQINRSRSAAVHAEEAATAARETVLYVTSVSDLSHIVSQMDQLKELHRNQEWRRAIDRYSPLRRLLSEARGRLPDDAHDKLSFAIIQIGLMEKEVNDALTEESQILGTRLNSILVDLQQSLDEARVELEKYLPDVLMQR